MPTQAELIDEATARELAPVMGIIDQQMARMEDTTKATVYKEIREGTLTSEKAMAYWMEMYAYSRLNKRLTVVSTAQGAPTHG